MAFTHQSIENLAFQNKDTTVRSNGNETAKGHKKVYKLKDSKGICS